MSVHRLAVLIVTLAALTLTGCGLLFQEPATPTLPAAPLGEPLQLPARLGLPPIAVPADNPPTAATIALGQKLFFSKQLSRDNSIACATCHDPQKGFADGQRTSAGVGGKKGVRNSPSVRNAALYTSQFWDGRVESLEDQASGPMMNSIEMAHSPAGIVQRCTEDAELRAHFITAFGPAPNGQSPVTMERLTRALASFERTLARGNSPFDRFLFAGDSQALTASAQRGLVVFRDPAKGNCAVCHLIGSKNAPFTDNRFHNLGVGMNPEGELIDLGRFLLTSNPAERGAFRTPTLRDVAETAPYMHDGSLKTLKEVVDFYVGGGNANPQRDSLLRPLTHLTGTERADLVAFLKSLTGTTE